MSKDPSSVTIDVRSLLNAGIEPLPQIREASQKLAPGQTLVVISPFLPSPLIERLQAEGFTVKPNHRHDGAWETHFHRE